MNEQCDDRVLYEIRAQHSADVTNHHLEHLFHAGNSGRNKSPVIRLSSCSYDVRQKKIIHVYTLQEEHSLLTDL